MISIAVLLLVKLIIYDIIDTVECGNFHSGLMSLLASISLQTITVLTLVLQDHPGRLGVLVPPTVGAGLDNLMKFVVSLRYCDPSETFLQQTTNITTRNSQREVVGYLVGKVQPPDWCVDQAVLLEDPVAPVEPVLVDLRGVDTVVDLVGHQVGGVTQRGGPGTESLPVRQGPAVLAHQRTGVALLPL